MTREANMPKCKEQFYFDMLNASRDIGAIIEMAGWASESLANILALDHPGKAVDELTVGQIREALARQEQRWQRIHERAL